MALLSVSQVYLDILNNATAMPSSGVGGGNSVVVGIEVAVVRIGPAPHERDLPCRATLEAELAHLWKAIGDICALYTEQECWN